MRFSILLPTRNRLEYLRFAVESVLRQDFDDWEVVVQDNCSDQDVEGYVRSLGDARIRYFRTDSFVPVTENWNHALDKSRGDYVIMLGDDDCLLRGALAAAHKMILRHQEPDLIYANGLIFAYPGVIPDAPEGYLNFVRQPGSAGQEPFWLSPRAARKQARGVMRFVYAAGLNMQYSFVRRAFIKSLEGKGPFFQSPYPDFYATTVMWLKAARILFSPAPLAIIGITKKSFGYFHFNDKKRQGMETLLKNFPEKASMEKLREVLLPGPGDISSWLFAMETVRQNYGDEFNLKVGYGRYRWLQIAYAYKGYFLDKSGEITAEQFEDLRGHMFLWERALYGLPLELGFRLMAFLPARAGKALYAALRRTASRSRVKLKDVKRKPLKNILDAVDFIGPVRA